MPTNPQIETEIDRLARALQDSIGPVISQNIRSPGDGGALYWDDYPSAVCAVLLALREPTDGMMEAGFEAMFTSPWDGSQAPMMGAGWQAMIDHILNERDGHG